MERHQLSAILDNTSDAILLLNADGQIENSNAAFQELLGYDDEDCGAGSTVRVMLCASASVGEAHCAALDVFDGQIPTAVTEGRFVLGLVLDDGPGIREDDRAHLFTRFFRGWAAETDIPGTGLGLSLVKEILEAYGGDIVVHSVVGAGTAFCFWLPI